MQQSKTIIEVIDGPIFLHRKIIDHVLTNLQIKDPDFSLETFYRENELAPLLGRINEVSIDIQYLVAIAEYVYSQEHAEAKSYFLGNNMHAFHFQIVGLLQYFLSHSNQSFNIPSYQNIFSLGLAYQREGLMLKIDVNDQILGKGRNTLSACRHMLRGFFDQLSMIMFQKKLEFIQNSSLCFTLRLLDFIETPSDFVRFVGKDQVNFQALKYFLLDEVELSLDTKIRQLLNRDIRFSVEEIAGQQNMSVRSLQRKLKEDNLTFGKIKEEVRKELVYFLVRKQDLKTEEISDLLGYTERSAFERAFKKWFGMNLKVYRDQFLK